jgi:hypothetical protein
VINGALPEETDGRRGIERVTLFQVSLRAEACPGTLLVARPSRRAVIDQEDRVAALLYRNAREYAAGHTCSATWQAAVDSDHADWVSTTWMPRAVVPAISSRGHPVFADLARDDVEPLSAAWLANASDNQLEEALLRLVSAYRSWISIRHKEVPSLAPDLRASAEDNLAVCAEVARRMEEGAHRVANDPAAALAFRLANEVMSTQHGWDPEKRRGGALVWRPFQLGFILLAAASIADRDHPDRRTMDLLWFPTGGGKTEAYLALIAFLAFHRRLAARSSPDHGAGIAAIMRYTLRLLTTQQFARAAAVLLACEAVRCRRLPGLPGHIDLGATPFSIGLWVGGDATPNKFNEARDALSGASDVASPKQLLRCPACTGELTWRADPDERSVHVHCPDGDCVLHDPHEPMPVPVVYR